MNKKCTLLAVAAFMVAGAFSADAQSSVPVAKWTVGNYYYLKDAANNYLALSGDKADSVIVKTIDESTATKASIDSALWQITNAGTTIGGTAYQFTNKATQTVLSFAAEAGAVPNLAAGIAKWLFADGGEIHAYYGNNQYMALSVTGNDLELAAAPSGTDFTVTLPPSAFVLNAEALGNGFSVFQLMFGGTYGGNIFAGQEILAKDVPGTDFMTLQLQSDQSFSNGTPKYFGVDTAKTVIAGATGVFGAKFVVDSTYTDPALHTVLNADFQKFMFTIDLMNDSLAMYVLDAPVVNASPIMALGDTVRVVYASVGATAVLTVSNLAANSSVPAQGTAPMITVKKGTPGAIATGTGVYYLKSASVNTAGKYWVSASASTPMMRADSLSVYHAKGQWYVKENNGKYSIASRYDGTELGVNKEIFPVQNMPDTYTISGRTDSITFVHQANVDFADKYLGVRHFSVDEIANHGYQLSAVADLGVGNLPVFAADSMLRAQAGSTITPVVFKVAVVDNSILNTGVNTGAVTLGDTLHTATYKLVQQFTNDSVANNAQLNNTGLVLTSTSGNALTFTFVTALQGGKYVMTNASQFVSLDINNANLILSDKVAYFDFAVVDAPEYASLGNGHEQIGTNGKCLTMNPLNFYAEVKNVVQEILKADYTADNFSLWVEKADTVVPGKSLYYISTASPTVQGSRYYLVSLRDSNKTFVANGSTYYRAGFITSDTIKTMTNSPALFAFKTTPDKEFLLENQRELNRTLVGGSDFLTPYIGVVNNVVVVSNVGVPFTVENVSAPTGNEDITTSDVLVSGGTDNVTVYNATGKKVTLTNVLGQVIATVTATSDDFTVSSEKGIILVVVEGADARKVIVR